MVGESTLGSAQVLEYSWWLVWVLQAVWVVRLWRLGLARRYPSLVTFFAFATVSSLIGYSLFSDSQFRLWLGGGDISPLLYSWFYVISQPITWALYLCVLIEAYHRTVENYAGLQRLSQLATYGIAASVGVLVLGIVVLDSSGDLPVSRLVATWIRAERSIYLGLTVFCLALAAFLAHFHLSVPKNVRLVFGVFGVYFAGQVLLLTPV